MQRRNDPPHPHPCQCHPFAFVKEKITFGLANRPCSIPVLIGGFSAYNTAMLCYIYLDNNVLLCGTVLGIAQIFNIQIATSYISVSLTNKSGPYLIFYCDNQLVNNIPWTSIFCCVRTNLLVAILAAVFSPTRSLNM